MKAFHVITGLPRAGSTLLCNLLAQNPKLAPSSTSALCATLANMSAVWTQAPEIRSDLAHDRKGTEQRLARALGAVVKAWYPGKGIVFDKSRAWLHHVPLLRSAMPDARLIVCVRDPRNVLASIEKQNAKHMPMLSENPDRTLAGRTTAMFAPNGMIGGPLAGVEDALRRRWDGLVVVQYEQLSQTPELVLERVYADLGLPYFAHDFDHVENVSTDLDSQYLHKFPHEGCGKVEACDPEEWKQWVSTDIASELLARHRGFCAAFGYA